MNCRASATLTQREGGREGRDVAAEGERERYGEGGGVKEIKVKGR